jgi:uncharacterized protein YndB with AHSA1/START domain
MSPEHKQPIGEVIHATLVFERLVPAPVDQVFAAFADAAAKSEWGAPSDTSALIYDKTDFREGGIEQFRCGSKSGPNIHGTTHYLSIIQNSRIVSSETIDFEGKRLCASLTTLELFEAGDGTRLGLTSQVASFIGQDMINGHESGNNASLDKLCRYFSSRLEK